MASHSPDPSDEPRPDPLGYVGTLSRAVVLTTSIGAVVVALVLLVVVLT
jgi:hypothetical protein